MQFRDKPVVRCGIGLLFKHVGGGNYQGYYYLLAKSGYSKAALINLKTGMHWSTPVAVADQNFLSEAEWKALVSDGAFELTENPYHEA